MVFKRPKKGDKKGWSTHGSKKNSGYIYDGTHWVQYKGGKPTGRKEKHGFSTTEARGLGVGSLVKKIRGKDNKNNSSSNKSTLTKNTKSKLTFKNMKEAGLLDKKSGSTTTTKKSADSEKAAWLKKTRNSPAAKSGAFTDDERWAQQQKHRKWKSDRKAKTEAKKNSKNKAALKAGKIEREANEWGPGGQPKASEQMKKYKPKKKKKKVNQTGKPGGKYQFTTM